MGYPDYMHTPFFYVRVASAGTNGLGTYYLVSISDPGTRSEGDQCAGYGQPYPEGNVGLEKVVDGAGVWVASTCASNTIVGTNQARLIVKGRTIEVIANGREVMRYTDSSNPIRYGGVGVGQLWETNGWFDNAMVWRHTTKTQ